MQSDNMAKKQKHGPTNSDIERHTHTTGNDHTHREKLARKQTD